MHFEIPTPILATASKDHSIKIWDIEYGKSVMTFDNGHG
mgnify:CR=1 FL=1